MNPIARHALILRVLDEHPAQLAALDDASLARAAAQAEALPRSPVADVLRAQAAAELAHRAHIDTVLDHLPTAGSTR